MPIYEYTCNECGKEFEELVFDDETPPCPSCASTNTVKLMSSCCHKSGGATAPGQDAPAPSFSGSGGGCSGCSGGSCATCK